MVKKMKKINVKAHKRSDPRLNKKVWVSSYERKPRFITKKYAEIRNKARLGVLQAKGLTKDNIGYIEYKILELIKLNNHYDKPTTVYDLFDELAFGTEDEDAIVEKVQNLRSQGVLRFIKGKTLQPTKEGNRIFWEFYEEYEDGGHLDHLKDKPKSFKAFEKDLRKEGFELIGTSEHPNETILYLKDLEKEAKKIDKQLKENIKFQKSKKK